MTHTYNPSTWEAADSESKASLGYIVRVCLKNQPKQTKQTRQNKPNKATITKALTNQSDDSNSIYANLGKSDRKLHCCDLPNTYSTVHGGKAQKLDAVFNPAYGRICKCC